MPVPALIQTDKLGDVVCVTAQVELAFKKSNTAKTLAKRIKVLKIIVECFLK